MSIVEGMMTIGNLPVNMVIFQILLPGGNTDDFPGEFRALVTV